MKYLITVLIVIFTANAVAQDWNAGELLKSIEVVDPIEALGNSLNRVKMQNVESADPKASAMVITYYELDGDSLKKYNERTISIEEERSIQPEWRFVKQRKLENTTTALEFVRDGKTFTRHHFIVDGDQLITKYSETDSISYHYDLKKRLVRTDYFEQEARIRDGSVAYEDEQSDNGEMIVNEETVIQDNDGDYEDVELIEEAAEVIEVVEDEYTDDIIRLLPAPVMKPVKTTFYTYYENDRITSIRTIENQAYQYNPQVDLLTDKLKSFTYDGERMLTAIESKRSLETIKDLPANNSLVYWVENVVDDQVPYKVAETDIALSYTDEPNVFTLTEYRTRQGERKQRVSVLITRGKNGVTSMEGTSDNYRFLNTFEYDENGYLIKETEESYRDGALARKLVKKREFLYE
ncbi:hypothetical protein [Nonlabens ponticola]|uniref:DUF4595 domain-containing protein n=1 Tax=Nonlabens ponticola TaxID=2496866 RepID=A0A3S9MY04_9FLAO|nr:hypothetical protein [Nonlabens ponticola]AZQ44012.1 hypothetical protein EJ995_07110 [Nonlabens ponticola]